MKEIEDIQLALGEVMDDRDRPHLLFRPDPFFGLVGSAYLSRLRRRALRADRGPSPPYHLSCCPFYCFFGLVGLFTSDYYLEAVPLAFLIPYATLPVRLLDLLVFYCKVPNPHPSYSLRFPLH